MLTSVPYPREPERAPDDDPYTVRLRGLSHQQLTDAMSAELERYEDSDDDT